MWGRKFPPCLPTLPHFPPSSLHLYSWWWSSSLKTLFNFSSFFYFCVFIIRENFQWLSLQVYLFLFFLPELFCSFVYLVNFISDFVLFNSRFSVWSFKKYLTLFWCSLWWNIIFTLFFSFLAMVSFSYLYILKRNLIFLSSMSTLWISSRKVSFDCLTSVDDCILSWLFTFIIFCVISWVFKIIIPGYFRN